MYIHFSASIALKEVVKARIEATSVTGLRASKPKKIRLVASLRIITLILHIF